MKILNSIRCALGLSTFVVLAGCGNAVLQPRVNAAQSTETAAAPRARHGQSWMSPDARQHDLLYATDSAGSEVFVFSYPIGKLEGALTGAGSPEGDCVDREGNVWFTDASGWRVLEYAHGGTTPIAILTADINEPYDCAIDPTTGNLAVINSTNVIPIFRRARGTPTLYSLSGDPLWATYDDKGDLFVDGYNTKGIFQFSELAKGSSAFVEIALPKVTLAGDVKWDGKYLAVGDLRHKIYQVQVKASRATIVGSTSGVPDFYFCFPNAESDSENRQAGKIIATNDTAFIELFDYPLGGSALKTLDGDSFPSGLAISLAKN